MAHKSGNVTVRVLASMALAFTTCTRTPLPAEKDDPEKAQLARTQQPGCASGYYYYPGGCGYSRGYGYSGGYGSSRGLGSWSGGTDSTGARGLVSGNSGASGSTTTTSTGSISRGGFGSSGASHGIAA